MSISISKQLFFALDMKLLRKVVSLVVITNLKLFFTLGMKFLTLHVLSETKLDHLYKQSFDEKHGQLFISYFFMNTDH